MRAIRETEFCPYCGELIKLGEEIEWGSFFGSYIHRAHLRKQSIPLIDPVSAQKGYLGFTADSGGMVVCIYLGTVFCLKCRGIYRSFRALSTHDRAAHQPKTAYLRGEPAPVLKGGLYDWTYSA